MQVNFLFELTAEISFFANGFKIQVKCIENVSSNLLKFSKSWRSQILDAKILKIYGKLVFIIVVKQMLAF